MEHILRPLPLIICALLAIATADLPYGYYRFLRISVTVWGIMSIIQLNKKQDKSSSIAAELLIIGGITILYNPVLSIHLSRPIWTVINIISIPLVLLSSLQFYQNTSSK